MRSSIDIAHSLLYVDKERIIALSPRVKLMGCMLAFVNLFPSAFSENLLQTDATGYYLSLFLLVHSIVYVLFALAYSIGTSQQILFKAKIFPTTPLGRMGFVAISVLRHPFSIALIASNSFFLMILYRQNIATGFVAVILYVLLMLTITSLSAIVFLWLNRKKASASIALMLVVLFALFGFVGILIFHTSSIMESIPLVSSCVKGIQSALVEDYFGLAANSLVLLVSPLVCVFIGIKVG